MTVEHGSRVTRLETNGALREAVALYRSGGYRGVDAFNGEPYADHWVRRRSTGVRARKTPAL